MCIQHCQKRSYNNVGTCSSKSITTCSRDLKVISLNSTASKQKTTCALVVHFPQVNRGFARQPCCMAGTTDSFSMGTNVLSYAKHFHCFCHATWLPCKTSILHLHRTNAVDKIFGPQSTELFKKPTTKARYSHLSILTFYKT